jgi:hypothetical protein
MQTSGSDAFLEKITRLEFDAVVKLYDRFAHADNPFDPVADKAEDAFNQTLQLWYDRLAGEKFPFQDFRRTVIFRCKLQILNELNKPTI